MPNLCYCVYGVTFILLLWFLITQLKEPFSESISANPKLGQNLIRGSSVYFAPNAKLDKGFLSKQKFE
jgi:hypothetical protein